MADKKLEIVLAEGGVGRFEEAFAHTYSYKEKILDPDWKLDKKKPEIKHAPMIANPESKLSFGARMIKENFIRTTIVSYESAKERRIQAQKSKEELAALGI